MKPLILILAATAMVGCTSKSNNVSLVHAIGTPGPDRGGEFIPVSTEGWKGKEGAREYRKALYCGPCQEHGHGFYWLSENGNPTTHCIPCTQAVSPEARFVCFGVTYTAEAPMSEPKRMTDESVAKALGYKVTTKAGVPSILKTLPDGRWDRGSSLRLPAFTTSLDAIVAEIYARGLWWQVKFSHAPRKDWEDTQANAGLGEQGVDAIGKWADAKTAPLALCAALLSHLKEKP